MIPPEALREITVFLYRGSGFHSDPLGSGFFLAVDEGELTHAYLVTCKHVVKAGFEKNGTLQIRLNRSDTIGVGASDLPKSGWLYHPDPGIDLAVLPYHDRGAKPLRLVVPRYSDDILLPVGVKVQAGDDAVFVGLFPKAPGQLRNNPVFRFSRVVAPIEEKIKGPEFGPAFVYSIECHFNRGNSGAPLWRPAVHAGTGKNVMLLMGVICAGYPDAGIAVAHPIQRVGDILHGKEAKRLRQERLAKTSGLHGGAVSLSAGEPQFTDVDVPPGLRKVAKRKANPVRHARGKKR